MKVYCGYMVPKMVRGGGAIGKRGRQDTIDGMYAWEDTARMERSRWIEAGQMAMKACVDKKMLGLVAALVPGTWPKCLTTVILTDILMRTRLRRRKKMMMSRKKIEAR